MENDRIIERERIVEPGNKIRERDTYDQVEYVETEEPAVVRSDDSVRPLYRGTQIVWYLFWILEALLILRFVMKLLGANPTAGFTDFVYTITAPFLAPFTYVFGTTTAAGAVIEWPTLLAMFVYWLIAYAITQLLAMGRPVDNDEAREGLVRQDNTTATRL